MAITDIPAPAHPHDGLGPRGGAAASAEMVGLLEGAGHARSEGAGAGASGDGAELDPLAGLTLGDRQVWVARARRAALPLGVAAAAVALLAALGGPVQTLADALGRALEADPRWIAAGAAFEALSFTGYVALLWLVGGRRSRRLGVRASGQVTLAGAAATRLLPTAGLGGVALTLWALRRSGLERREAAAGLLTFLVLLYAVFLGGLAVAGALLLTGAAPGDGPLAVSAFAAVFGTTSILVALGLAAAAPKHAPARRPSRLRFGAALLGHAVRDAIGHARRPDPRLLGGLLWWGFDVAVLWATFHALGTPPPAAVLVLAYFVGAIGNTIPVPGLVAGGTTGVLLAFGVEADLALGAVLAYRAIALWLPAPAGAAAIVGLRATAARWACEDGAESPARTLRPARRFERAPCADRVPARAAVEPAPCA